MSDIESEIDDYLTRYVASLTDFDSRGAAKLWAVPGMLVDDRFAGTVDSRDDMVEGLERSYPLYKQLGLARVGHELLSHQELTDAITLVHVRWLFYDAYEELLTDGNPYYLLRRDEDGLRACVCIQTDDLHNLRALAHDRGVDLRS